MPPSTGNLQAEPRNYAPHLDDPDPPQEPMTPDELKSMGQKVKALMQRKGHLKT